jgi:hypothetical protein
MTNENSGTAHWLTSVCVPSCLGVLVVLCGPDHKDAKTLRFVRGLAPNEGPF